MKKNFYFSSLLVLLSVSFLTFLGSVLYGAEFMVYEGLYTLPVENPQFVLFAVYGLLALAYFGIMALNSSMQKAESLQQEDVVTNESDELEIENDATCYQYSTC